MSKTKCHALTVQLKDRKGEQLISEAAKKLGSVGEKGDDFGEIMLAYNEEKSQFIKARPFICFDFPYGLLT